MRIISFIFYVLSIPFALVAFWQVLLFFAALLDSSKDIAAITVHFMIFCVCFVIAWALIWFSTKLKPAR